VPETKTFKQQMAEAHYLPGRDLRADVLEARQAGHSWRDIADKVNDYLAKNPTMKVDVSHESLRAWFGHLDSPAGRAAG
jgi:hypothetical protein